MNTEVRTVTLQKGQHRFVYRCRNGHESELMRSLVAAAKDTDSGLDWYDAAVLSHQLAQQMERAEQAIG